MRFNDWFLKKIYSQKEIGRKEIGYLEGWISIIGNIILFIFKFISGIYLNSISLTADAFHSLSDVLTSIVVILGFKFGEKPADKKHPFGHGRIEQIATLIIAFMLLIIAYDLGKSSFERIIKPQKVSFNIFIVFLMFFSALFKEWMARFSIFLGNKINSSTLIADAWHHRSDAFASALVAFGLLAINYGLYIIDGIMGFFVSLLLLWVGIDLIKNSSSFLIGEAPTQEFINKIKNIVFSIPGVLDYHDISIHDYQNKKVITLHIVVDNNISAKDAHDIALKVQDSIKENIQGSQVIVHIDPKGERED
ncbi:MAG: cation diffusion facilitator family transporter [Dictyoglomus sp.]|nr:cation diffusion facilitator family transporter [Dictyoglomus sp.]MCX7942654.1 cation diffusion facilitator family transporter [Dictyoglomaceae bacterium]MDW8187914.1 cation diffusion facilitator family transporter [Dictyoglomus sp.]